MREEDRAKGRRWKIAGGRGTLGTEVQEGASKVFEADHVETENGDGQRG